MNIAVGVWFVAEDKTAQRVVNRVSEQALGGVTRGFFQSRLEKPLAAARAHKRIDAGV